LNCLVLVIAICRLNASVPVTQEDSRFEVHGSVRDSSGAVVPGAQVNLTGADFERGQTTDAQGRFSFSSVPVSTAAISVEAVGFTMVEHQWEAHSQGPAALEIVPDTNRRPDTYRDDFETSPVMSEAIDKRGQPKVNSGDESNSHITIGGVL